MIPLSQITEGLEFTWRADLPKRGGWQKIEAKCTVLGVKGESALVRVEYPDKRGTREARYNVNIICEVGYTK